MGKAVKHLPMVLMGLAGLLSVLAVLLPVAVPPIVERFVTTKISEFGLVARARMDLGWCWRNGPGLAGGMTVSIVDSPWRINATFGASCCEWSASAKMDSTPFSETDPVLLALREKYPVKAVSNLVFSGSVSLDARAERTFRKPVPVWSVRMPIRDFSARTTVEGKTYALNSLSVTPAASGIADHLDISPMFLRVASADLCGFALTNFTASIHASEKALLVTEATAGFCGGRMSLYSLFLDPKTLNTGFTLFVDDMDAGEVLSHLKGFRGEASGRLHGKIRLFAKGGGKALRLGDAFLYSTPGELGKLRMTDVAPVTDNLALAGMDGPTRANVADALANLDYSVLRLDLRHGTDKAATLSVTLNGTATRGSRSVPVSLSLNFNGALDQFINTGLDLSTQMKGKHK